MFGVNYVTFFFPRQAALDLIRFHYTDYPERWLHTFRTFIRLHIGIYTMQLIYYKTVLGHEFCPYFGKYPILVFKRIEHSERRIRRGTLKLAVRSAYKTIKRY